MRKVKSVYVMKRVLTRLSWSLLERQMEWKVSLGERGESLFEGKSM
jgi:hypothetical protein